MADAGRGDPQRSGGRRDEPPKVAVAWSGGRPDPLSSICAALEDHGWNPAPMPIETLATEPQPPATLLLTPPAGSMINVVDAETTVPWVLGDAAAWIDSGMLAAFPFVICASRRMEAAVRRVSAAETLVVPEGADPPSIAEPSGRNDRSGVVVTVGRGDAATAALELAGLGDLGAPLAVFGAPGDVPDHLAPWHRGPLGGPTDEAIATAEIVVDVPGRDRRRDGTVGPFVLRAPLLGALPVTSARLGLNGTDLHAVPGFRWADELRDLLGSLLDDREGRARRVGDLARAVRDGHSWAHRVEQVDRSLRARMLARGDLGSTRRGRRPGRSRRRLVFFPDYRATNPYQGILYSRLSRRGVRLVPLRRLEDVERVAADPGPDVLHLNWTAPIIGTGRRDAVERVERFTDAVSRFKRAGGRSIWTLHNILPHETPDASLEVRLRNWLADHVDRVHVMCRDTVPAAASHYRLPEQRLVELPHASYRDIYPNVVSRDRARGELGLPEDAVTILTFGQIRPYKGIEDLLHAHEEVLAEEPGIRLMVVGEVRQEMPGLLERLRGTSGVVAHLRAVPDEEVQRFFSAADLVALPYRHVLNSGTAHLALSFGCPVVAPRMGCLPAAVQSGTGVLYDATDRGLTSALREGVRRFGRGQGRRSAELACLEAASAWTPTDMADAFADVVDELVSRDRP